MSTATFDTLSTPRALDGGELRALFGACADGTPAGARDAAAFALMVGDRGPWRPPQWQRDGMMAFDPAFAMMFGAGLCRAEAAAVTLADFDRESGAVRVPPRCRWIGQGIYERTVYVTDGPAAAVDAWLRVRGWAPGPLLAPVSQGGAVQVGRGMSAQALSLRLRLRARQVGIADCSTRALRRSLDAAVRRDFPRIVEAFFAALRTAEGLSRDVDGHG